MFRIGVYCMKYFDIADSINNKWGTEIEPILNTIALRYIGQKYGAILRQS